MMKRSNSEEINSYGFFVSREELNVNETVDPKKQRRREKKWLDMFNRWPVFFESRFDTLKKRCRKGIPASVRGRAWFHLSAAQYRQAHENDNSLHGDLFQYYLKQEINQKVLDDIKKDLPRSFPDHEMFRGDDACGQDSLYDVLRAYAAHDQEVGYCQAQAPIAAILLMNMSPEEAFWVFVQINEEYVKGYFNDGLMAIKIDALATELLIKQVSPKAYRLLKKLDVAPVLYTVDWYMTLFSRTYRAPELYRIWDIFFCEGVKILFRLALVIVREALDTGPVNIVKRAHRCDNSMDVVGFIRETAKQMQFDDLFKKIDKLPVSDIDLAQACRQAKQEIENEFVRQ